MISVILPISEREYFKNLKNLLKYPEICEVIVVDSSHSESHEIREFSNDDRLKFIREEQFDHGASRNRGAKLARGEILLFMTQDAVPFEDNFAREIISSFSGKIRAVYGKQIADESNVFEFFERKNLYPDYQIIKRYKTNMTFQDFFVSDACFAVEKEIFWNLGGFPENIISSEELILSIKILKSGYYILYNPNVKVLHTHNENLVRNFKRWFDVGVAFSHYPEVRRGFFGFAGKLCVKELVYFLKKDPSSLFYLLARIFVRSAGIALGMNWRMFGKYSYYLSLNKNFFIRLRTY